MNVANLLPPEETPLELVVLAGIRAAHDGRHDHTKAIVLGVVLTHGTQGVANALVLAARLILAFQRVPAGASIEQTVCHSLADLRPLDSGEMRPEYDQALHAGNFVLALHNGDFDTALNLANTNPPGPLGLLFLLMCLAGYSIDAPDDIQQRAREAEQRRTS